MSDYKMKFCKVKIKDVSLVGDGAHASIKRRKEGVLYLTSKNFKSGGLDLSNVDYISEADYEKHFLKGSNSITNVKENDVVFSIIGSIGMPYIIKKDDEFGLSSSVAILRPNSTRIKSKYLYYWILSDVFQGNLRNIKSGVAQGFISLGMINNLPVVLPPLDDQLNITNILSTYDKLIENNNRRIEILEQTAEELYKEWFVRMRFPGYEKTKFDKGIPEGWEVRRIGDFIDLKSGYAFKSSWWKKTGIPVVKIKDIQNNTLDFSALSYVSTENAEKSKQFYLSPGDLLIALTGATIGKIALVPYFAYDKLTVNQRVGKFFLGDKPIENVAFFYFLFLQTHIQEQIISIGNSNAAQPNISPLDIKNIKILYNETVINKFNSSVKKYINLILKLKETNQNLIKQRDLLLPRLMNGTITVK